MISRSASRTTSRTIWIVTAGFMAATLCLTGTANGQILYGSLVGTVADQSGALMAGVPVRITKNATGSSHGTVTDGAGRFSILNIPPGTYTMRVSAPGFRSFEQRNVVVSLNAVVRAEATLEVGGATETVTVVGMAAPLQTDKPDTHVEFTEAEVANLPLMGYRNYQTMINLVPGATPTEYENGIIDTPARSLTTHINGTAKNNNNTRVDGAANINIFLPHNTLYNPPVEAIQAVNVSTSAFDADQGMTGGAAITVTTKSGTNDLHGTAFWYHDNNVLKARPYFWYQEKPLSIDNIAGGTIGGPIKKDTLFYFVSYERTSQRIGLTARLNLPPEDIRRGDFSRYIAYSKIYDPLSGKPDGSGRIPFPDNVIPRSRISPIFDAIQTMAPLPNRGGLSDDAWGLQGNYDASGVTRMDRDQWDVKFDWNAGRKLSVWGKYSRMDALVNGATSLGELVGPDLAPGTGGIGDTSVQIPTLGYTYAFSPSFLMDGNFSYTRLDQALRGPDHGKFWGSDIWGIPGTNGGTQYARDEMYSGMPALAFPPFTQWGSPDPWLPSSRNDRSYLFSTNFTKVRGAHEVRFGYDGIRHELSHWQPETANPRGSIVFGANATMIKGGTGRSINSYASALLGIVTNYAKSVQFLPMKTREWQHALYIRDRWQATRNLTLTLGLRYEYYPLVNRGDRGLERWDPNTNMVTLGGIGRVPFDNGITVSKKLFAPRFGFAYRLGGMTILRSGYGLTYDPLPFGRPLRGLYPATVTGKWNALDPYGYFNTLSQGIPEVPLPDISTGTLTLPADVDMGACSPWGGEIHRGYIQSWNLTLERRLPLDLVASAAYVGTQTTHQLGFININAAPLGAGNSGRPLFATQGRQIGANMLDGFASGNYHALQATLDRRFNNGLMLKTSYTWSKSINLFDETGWANLRWTNWAPDLRRNRTVASYDRTHMFTSDWVYQIPVGTGKALALSGPANLLLGGWQINGIFVAYSGRPFSVTAGDTSLNMPGTLQGANLIAPVKKVGNKGPGSWYYDPGSFGDPNFHRPADVYRFGNMGPNSLRGPGFWRTDVGMFKSFRLSEWFKMEFKCEAFNLTNTPRFGNPVGGVSSMQFNPDGSIKNVNNFMAILNARDERQIRFGIRLSF